MHPFLFDLRMGSFHLHPPTYGIFLALAFSAAYFMSLRRAFKLGDNPKHIENLFLIVVVASILGSRLFHVIFEEPAYYFAHPEKIIAVWEGGYTLYGAMLASILGVFLYCRRRRLSFFHFGDIAAPSTAIGIFLGRLGCFFAGCCWGKPTHSFLGVRFTHPLTFCELKNTPLHPSQLYEAVGCLLIFFYLEWRFKNRKYPGQILLEGLVSYSVLRFIVEVFRGDAYRGYVGLLSYSQLVSVIVFAGAVFAIFRMRHS